MFDYLQKFNALPPDLRAKISAPAVMAAISSLESKYGVDLAMSVMRVMIKTLSLNDLPLHFSSEFGLNQAQAENLSRDLKDQVFIVAATYLGLNPDPKNLDLNQNLEKISRAAGVSFPSADLNARFKQILNTYLRGVRTRIDTRNSLAKSAASGGLNLDVYTVDKIFKACDELIKKLPAPEISRPPQSSTLQKLIVSDILPTKKIITHESEYNLKNLAATGQLKPLDLSHELTGPKAQLDLPKGDEQNSAVLPFPVSPDSSQTPPRAPLQAPGSAVPPIPSVGAAVKSALAPAINNSSPTLKTTPPVSRPTPVPLVKKPLAAAAGLRPASDSSRPRLADIRPLPKIMGPIEELQFLDLINFRRLASRPEEITAKIYNKIRLLEKTGYDQMIGGVMAWRKGIINRLYLKMCQEAFSKGLTLKEIISRRQQERRECLSWDEISAIVELNKKLMF